MRFEACDIDDAPALERLMAGADLLVHAAGPFQWKEGCGVLEAALATRTPYMDVCDDTDFSQRAKVVPRQSQPVCLLFWHTRCTLPDLLIA